MTLHQLITTVIESRPEEWIYNDERQTWIYELDLDVRFEGEPISFEHQPEEFVEPWTKQFPNPQAFRAIFQLCYRSSKVRDYYFVDVDGHRALLPLPRRYNEMVITREQDRVARILNRAHQDNATYFREYIELFTVAEAAALRPV